MAKVQQTKKISYYKLYSSGSSRAVSKRIGWVIQPKRICSPAQSFYCQGLAIFFVIFFHYSIKQVHYNSLVSSIDGDQKQLIRTLKKSFNSYLRTQNNPKKSSRISETVTKNLLETSIQRDVYSYFFIIHFCCNN